MQKFNCKKDENEELGQKRYFQRKMREELLSMIEAKRAAEQSRKKQEQTIERE
jgi:hypothetical protein